MTKKTKHLINRLLVDESISSKQLNACKKKLEDWQLTVQHIYSIAEHHPGMSDNRILKTLMEKSDAMVTADRPFHNRLLKENFNSFYVNDQLQVTRKTLVGIRAATLPANKGQDGKEPEMSSLHQFIMPRSDKALKKFRTKRRRIRNHFGGYEQLNQLSITLTLQGKLIGIHLRVAGNSAKGIMASENYILETDPNTGVAALCQALILTQQLVLHGLDTCLYYDPLQIPSPHTVDDPFYHQLKKEFPAISFTPSTKGPQIEAIRKKLNTLLSSNTNEIVASRLAEIRLAVTVGNIPD